MGLVYLFALVVGLGTLLVQIAMGGKGDAPHAAGDSGEPELEVEAGGHAASHASHGVDGAHGHGIKHVEADADAGAIALFFSTRFWIFALLAFGMSGSLIHVFGLAGTLGTLLLAGASGFTAGLFAVLVFRAVKRASRSTSAHASHAVGQIGRVLVACGRGRKGQVRVEILGHSVDMLATTDEAEIARGEMVLIEDVRSHVAHISRRPPELE